MTPPFYGVINHDLNGQFHGGALADAQHGDRSGAAGTLHGLGQNSGVITDAQHGARGAIVSAHAHPDLAGVTADQHHAQAHVHAHTDLTGVTASQHHPRTEAKATAGAAPSESVTWTTAFTTTPVVACAVITEAATAHIANVSARSTTGATTYSFDNGGAAVTRVKMLVAQEAT